MAQQAEEPDRRTGTAGEAGQQPQRQQVRRGASTPAATATSSGTRNGTGRRRRGWGPAGRCVDADHRQQQHQRLDSGPEHPPRPDRRCRRRRRERTTPAAGTTRVTAAAVAATAATAAAGGRSAPGSSPRWRAPPPVAGTVRGAASATSQPATRPAEPPRARRRASSRRRPSTSGRGADEQSGQNASRARRPAAAVCVAARPRAPGVVEEVRQPGSSAPAPQPGRFGGGHGRRRRRPAVVQPRGVQPDPRAGERVHPGSGRAGSAPPCPPRR